MYIYGYGIEYIFIILSIAITLGAQFFINYKYNQTKQISVKKNLTGREVARKILDNNDLKNVKVEETSGLLSDHYDPRSKVVRLSSDIYNTSSIASVAVAAHECGHAIQDKNNYLFLRFRSLIIPLVNFSSTAGYIAILIGLISRISGLIMIGIIFELVILLFQLITLPVEFNASRRGLKQLKELKLEDKEIRSSRGMLFAAALTYVASVAATLLQIFRLLMIVKRDKR